MEKHETLVPRHQNDRSSADTTQNQTHVNGSSLDDSTTTPAAEEEREYVTGHKLIVVIAACTMAGFLMLLDTSIVATVSLDFTSVLMPSLLITTGHSQNYQRLPLPCGYWLVWDCLPTSQVSDSIVLIPRNTDDQPRSCALQPLTGKFYNQFDSKVKSIKGETGPSSALTSDSTPSCYSWYSLSLALYYAVQPCPQRC